MIRRHIAATAACAFSLLAFSFTSATAVAEDVISPLDRGAALYSWDAEQVITGENHLATSIPSTFTGTNVAPIIGADTFYTAGFNGTNSITTNVEAGHIWQGHETLGHVGTRINAAGVPSAPFGSPAFDRHATWVGMMIGGRLAPAGPAIYQTGVAANTDLRSGAVATSWGSSAYALSFGASVASLAFPYQSSFGVADTINSSWGAVGTSGSAEAAGSDIRSMIIDSLANANRFTTFVASAGNDGNSGNNTVGAPGSGYNGITVGALQNNGANVYNSVASFSSRGPQDYRHGSGGSILLSRAPVDIAAPGTNLSSAFYGGQTGGNDASLAGSALSGGPTFYSGGLNGTSFAAPITAGCVSLMHDAASTLGMPVNAEDTRIIKATLLNSARKIPGWTNAQTPHPNGNGGVVTTQSLDYSSGAGAIDMTRTYSQFIQGQTDIAGTTGGSTAQARGWDYATASVGSSTDITITTPLLGGSEFRATLTWFRDRTYISSSSQVDNGFADLNLQIWDSAFTTLISESKSLYNEVEHLVFNLPATGTYALRVQYAGNTFGSINAEEFGLAWWGTAVPEPTTLLLLLPALAAITIQRKRPGRNGRAT